MSALAALVCDWVLGEPPAPLHPTVWMGRAVAAGRRAAGGGDPPAALVKGAMLVAGGALATVIAAGAVERLLAARLPRSVLPIARGGALKPALALRALLSAAREVERALDADRLPEARRRLAWHLVSRDCADLTAEEVAGAAIESLAENLGDGLVGPLLGYRAAGLAGAYLYRFVNTCDSMLGYRTPELEWFGKTAARTDDALSFIPARATAALIVLAAPLVGADGPGAARCALRDSGATASPNAGWPMAAMAGALGVRLTKRGAYRLNEGGRAPTAADLRRARAVVTCAGALAAALVAR